LLARYLFEVIVGAVACELDLNGWTGVMLNGSLYSYVRRSRDNVIPMGYGLSFDRDGCRFRHHFLP